MKGVIGSPGRFLAARDNSSRSRTAGPEWLAGGWEVGRRWAAGASRLRMGSSPSHPLGWGHEEASWTFPFSFL